MGFWPLFAISFFGTFLATILALLLFSSPFKAFSKRQWEKVFVPKSHKQSRLRLEAVLLESLVPSLLKINSIPRYPDELKARDIRDILLNIANYAGKLESKDFEGIKNKLIEFGGHADRLDVNTNPLAALKMMGRDTAMNLVTEIRETISEGIERRKKKKN